MSIKIVSDNRRARHEYFILEKFEAGIVLVGTEVKSIREGKVNLKDGYAMIEGNEVYLYNCHISPYSHGNIYNHDPMRKRKLLLHRREIRKLIKSTAEKGQSIVPLKIYFKQGKAKVEISLAKGKKLYDKREDIKRKTVDRDIQKILKERNK